MNLQPVLLTLPFKASLRDSERELTFAQVNTLLGLGQAEAIQIERSYFNAPNAIGWTIFERTTCAYVHTGDPLFEAERDARRHIQKTYAIHHNING